MKTPKEYLKNLKNEIITDDMISDVLFSYSKRAKNYRDNARELRRMLRESSRRRWFGFGWFDDHNDIEKNEFRKQVLYDRKSDILNKFEERFLKCIHIQDKHATRRVYDYDREYNKICESDDVVWSNCYFDNDECREVWFVDVLEEEKEYLYFLYYEFPNKRSFHSPITQAVAEKYKKEKNLEVIELDDLTTFGEDVGILLSLQFCDKVYKFLFPEKTVFNISQPICVHGDSCRFYTNEEIDKYREEKEQKRKQAEIEREQRRIERKKQTEERRRQKKIDDANHKELLVELLKNKKIDDWNSLDDVVWTDDKIFDKIYKKLPDEQKKHIQDSFWQFSLKKYENKGQYEKLYNEVRNCPDKLKNIMYSIIDFVSVSNVVDNCHRQSKVCFDNVDDKTNEAFCNMVGKMVEYNGGLVKDNGYIHFIKNNMKWICFCHVPMFGNIYVEPKYSWNSQMREVFKHVEDKKQFNRTYQSLFTISHRLYNRMNVGYEKFKKEVKKLVNENNS